MLFEVRAGQEAFARPHEYDVRAMVADLREKDDWGDWSAVRLDPAVRPSPAIRNPGPARRRIQLGRPRPLPTGLHSPSPELPAELGCQDLLAIGSSLCDDSDRAVIALCNEVRPLVSGAIPWANPPQATQSDSNLFSVGRADPGRASPRQS